MVLTLLRMAGVSAVVFFGIALTLILSQRPGRALPEGGLAFSDQVTRPKAAALPVVEVQARDGAVLKSAHVAGPDGAPLVVLVHGSGWHGAQMAGLAQQLGRVAEVLVVNLRGHWNGPGTRGDITYPGQFEDDLADLITARRGVGQKVVLAGHSSGGGLVVRFAGGQYGGMLDGAVLLAPFLQHDAPTTRENAGGWAHPLTRRIIGLSMLNMVGVRALDGLVAIEFAMPEIVREGPLGDQATLAYSWRLNQSFAPRRAYLEDVAALPPFLLIAGAEDESFVAEGYAPLMSSANAGGAYHVLEGVNHLGVVDASETVDLMGAYLAGL